MISDKDLAESIDQLMSEIPMENRGEPTYKALELAWWHAENSHREFHDGNCSSCDGSGLNGPSSCGTCRQFNALGNRARAARL